MGLRVPSLKDMDWEVNKKRKQVTLNRPVKVVMWKVDGSALAQVASPARGTGALWRRMMMCSNTETIKHSPGNARVISIDADLNPELDDMGEEQPPFHNSVPHASNKLQAAFGMRRWPQGWI